MRLVDITELKIPDNRQRKEFDAQALMELQESIEKLGLMQPVVVRDGNILVAGERRLRAMLEIWALDSVFHCHNQPIPLGNVPVIDLGDLSPAEAAEAELDENIKRRDLSWQERAAAVAKLHELRVMQDANHKMSDTAREVVGPRPGKYGGPEDEVVQQILLSSHLSNPDVAKAKDAKEAFKILRRAEETVRNTALAEAVGKTFGAHSHVLLLGDCIEAMRTLGSGVFDVVCSDPPYGMGADNFGDGAGKLTAITHEYEDSPDSFRKLLAAVAPLLGTVAKKEAHLYLCCDIDQFHWLRELFTKVGDWNVFRTPLINVKRGSGRVPLPEHGPRRQYEIILYAHRGGKRTTAIYPDVIESEADVQLGHGAQKPVELFENLLKRSCRPGDRVFDPFAGTGTIFAAAHPLKVAATGIEKDPAYFGIGVRRIEELK